jgi:invasion protein IalB
VPLDLDAEMIAALREGTVLKVTVQSVDANEATLSVSLKGLGQQSTDSMC